jgi:dihydrofolate synthase/folylpolyglutamate synthase
MEIGRAPLTICDTGHNADAFQYLVPQAIDAAKGARIHWILGSAGDKDFGSIIELLPTENSTYYWTSTSSPRCAKSEILAEQASNYGRYGNHYPHVSNALSDAKQNAGVNDLIFIGGSTFVVADLDL